MGQKKQLLFHFFFLTMELLPDCYQQSKMIGKGSYGKVFRTQHHQRDTLSAVKMVPLDDGIPASVVREINMLNCLRHENIVKLLDVVLTPTHVILEMEYLEHDLCEFIRQYDCSVRIRRRVLRQILEGLEYCHDHWIAHRDLKPPNILINAVTGRVCLADFGMAKHQGVLTVVQHTNVELVTIWYRPPEVLLHQAPYCCKLDLWSVGCILAEMILHHPLYPGKTEEEMKTLITKTHQDDKKLLRSMVTKRHATESEIDLLEKLLEELPSQRISAAEALLHSYFVDL
jgi:cyclin-dependent kinase